MTQTGFFPAATADYSRGAEPEIAKRLDRLAHDLHLRIIGLSGYRTPQHSVAVGGFRNDPHTLALASDSPGVENVPESVLNKYGLTRPFGGSAEADHIQLLPSKHGGSFLDGVTGVVGHVIPGLGGPLGGAAVAAETAPGQALQSVEQTAASKAGSWLFDQLWGAIGQDATRGLLYVVLVGGGVLLALGGVKALTGAKAVTA